MISNYNLEVKDNNKGIMGNNNFEFQDFNWNKEEVNVNLLMLVKCSEKYIFLYDDKSRSEAVRTLGRFASNLDLSFTWYDAAVLSQKIRQDDLEENQKEKEKKPVFNLSNRISFYNSSDLEGF